jgi:hypothetical protein
MMTLLKKRWWKENWDTVVAIVGVIAVLVALCVVWLILYLSLEQEVAMTTAIGTIAIGLATAVYAWHTRRLAQEMREQRYDAVRPVIDVQWDPLNDARRLEEQEATRSELVSAGFSCRLLNIGLGPAIDIYSFVQSPSGERQLYYFGTLAKQDKTVSLSLSLDQKDVHLFVRARYKDIYGRALESSRELIGTQGNWSLGPLHIRLVERGANND